MPKLQLCLEASGSHLDVAFDDLNRDLIDRSTLIWLDLDRSERAALDRCATLFDLHPLAVESALLEDQRAQISIYDEMLFLECYGMRAVDDAVHVKISEIGIFVGERFVITVRSGNVPAIDRTCDRWHPERRRKPRHPSSSLLLYSLLDDLVDDYFPIIDSLGERVEDLEDRLMNEDASQPLQEIQRLRKELYSLRRVIGPQREVLNTLVRRDVPVIDQEIVVYLADVQDHLLRTLEWLDSYHDLMTTLFEVQLGLQSQRLDQVVRKLTAWSIMLMVASLIAGIYGMNFAHMPELHWLFGYPLALIAMLVSTLVLFLFFRGRQWF